MSTHPMPEQGLPAGWASTWRHELCAARMFGVRAWWSVTLNHRELARRVGAQLHCLRRLEIVDVLLNLPIGHPVADSSLSAREQRILAGLPRRVLDRTSGTIVRRARPPLFVDHALVPAQTFRSGLEAASTFSTYCATSMVLSRGAAPDDADLAEASFYGVGVYLVGATGMNEFVSPEPLPDWPETPASWVFSETLCDRLISTVSYVPS